MSIKKQIKGSNQGKKIGKRVIHRAMIKSNKTDAGGNFYTFNLFDKDGILIAKNRYVFKNSEKQLFEELTEEEELILNPPIVINEDYDY